LTVGQRVERIFQLGIEGHGGISSGNSVLEGSKDGGSASRVAGRNERSGTIAIGIAIVSKRTARGEMGRKNET
ncbi:MAG TPA: hypothetical protein VFG04_00240, partial [Planctomycetaceae bacterium]|nr:hypothetical protein [Planctomycetaceae bacterium]